MIRYRLECDRGHCFEAWFKNSAAFDRQVKRRLVSCVHCGSVNVSKAIMAPNVATRSKNDEKGGEMTVANREVTLKSEAHVQLRTLLRRLREEVEKHAEYVGDRFPEEARKIHYEEVEPRGIYGEATVEEARALKEEGIEFFPLPRLRDDRN